MMNSTFRRIVALLPLALPLYVVRFHIGPLPTTVLEIIVLAMIVVWIVTLFQNGLSKSPVLKKLTTCQWLWPVICWLIAGLISVVVAHDHIAALGLWRAYFLEPVLVFAMLADVLQTDADRRVLLQSTIVATVGVALYAILQYLGILSIPSPWNAPPSGIRATGPFPFPNALSLFAVPVAALCFAKATKMKKMWSRDTIWLWSGFAAGLVATALAKSAGGIIAICAAVFIALVLQKKTRLIAIGGTIAAILFILAIPSIRIPVTQKVFFDAWSGKVRLVMWQETWNMLRDRPIFGAGLGGYPDAIAPYHKATWMEIFQYPHDIFLNLWSETGLLGIVAFGWILWTWVRRRGAWLCALPVIAALLVHGLVDVPYFKNDLAILFWMFIILTSSPLPESDGVR